MSNGLENLSQEQVNQLLALLKAQEASVTGNRSPVHQQLKDLRPPQTERGRLHRPSFSWSADADPDTPPYTHQDFPKLMFHARQGEIVVVNEEAMGALGAGWQETPVVAANVTAYDQARAEFESLSPEDRDLVLSLQRDARIKRLQTAMAGFSEAEIASLSASTPDVPARRGPGRAKVVKPHGDGA